MKRKEPGLSLLTSALIISTAFFVLLPFSPANLPVPFKDSGVFLYAGSQILRGYVPYRYVWDHKPPLIFYINASGLALSGGSRWGVWGIEVVSLSLAALLGFRLIHRVYGAVPAAISILLLFLNFFVLIQGGNFTTEYALPVQLLCFSLACAPDQKERYFFRGIIIGVLCALLFLIRQNTVGIGVAICCYTILQTYFAQEDRKMRMEITGIFAGISIIMSLTVLFFWLQGALGDFWDASFVFNYYYCTQPSRSLHIQSIHTLFSYLRETNSAELSVLGWVTGFFLLIFRKNLLNRSQAALTALALFDLPVELIMIGTSARDYRHYSLSLLPAITILTAFLIHIVVNFPAKVFFLRNRRSIRVMTVCVIALAVIFETGPVSRSMESYWSVPSVYNDAWRKSLIQAISRITKPEDSLLVWGNATWLNFSTGLRSPSRFSYQFPIFYPGYGSKELLEEYLGDIERNKPAVIVDDSRRGLHIEKSQILSRRAEEILGSIRARYRMTASIGTYDIYTRVSDNF